MKKTNSLFSLFIAICTIAYIVMYMTAPTASAHSAYGLSNLQIRLLTLTIAIPVIGIIVASAYGALKFYSYADSIASRPDGGALKKVSHGLLALSATIAVQQVLGQFISRYNPASVPGADERTYGHLVVFQNYLIIALFFVSFVLLYRGSESLRHLIKPSRDKYTWLSMSLFAVFTMVYTRMVFTYPYRNAASSSHASYHLSDFWIAATIVAPYVVIWSLAFLTITNINAYAREAKGVIYRDALSLLSRGLGVVLVFSVLLQLLSTGTFLSGLSLSALLLMLYSLIVIDIAAYLLIAAGARKLSKIEVVA